MVPVETRLRQLTAMQAEKYRFYPPDDPLFELSHMALPRKRLHRASWQYVSDDILIQNGFWPARNDVHCPCPQGLISLENRKTISTVSQIAPWDLHDFDDRIHIAPTLQDITQSTPNLKRNAEQALSSLGPFDYAFWTDGSLIQQSYHSTAACFGHPTNESPLKRQRTDDLPSVAMSIPTGLAAASYTPKIKAFQLPAYHITQNAHHFKRKRILIASDSQSSLTAFNPLKRPKFAHVDQSESLNTILTAARATDSQITLQWIPAHAGIPGNTESDIIANNRCHTTSRLEQLQQPIEPATLKAILKKQEEQRFQQQVLLDTKHTGIRFQICGFERSSLSKRTFLPRPLQTLYSRWRIGQVDSCGTYPRRISHPYIENPACRFCGFPIETTLHLLTMCPGTSLYRATHGISLATLAFDTQANMLAIACFDSFLAHALPFDNYPRNQHSVHKALFSVLESRKRKRVQTSLQIACDKGEQKRQKTSRKYLLLPISDASTNSTWNTVSTTQTVVQQ